MYDSLLKIPTSHGDIFDISCMKHLLVTEIQELSQSYRDFSPKSETVWWIQSGSIYTSSQDFAIGVEMAFEKYYPIVSEAIH